MECWIARDNRGNVFDAYNSKETVMCYLINKIAEDEMPNDEKWIAFKKMYYAFLANDEISVNLSNDCVVYIEKRKAWGFKEDNKNDT